MGLGALGWPGEPEDGIRHRLRALFSHTGTPTESAIEELLAERGRELELRTEQLAATVADLQRREERARELRTAVEEMLRHGSAELDERHAQLNDAGHRARAAARRRWPRPSASRRNVAASSARSSCTEPRSSGARQAARSGRRRSSESPLSLQERERELEQRARGRERGAAGAWSAVAQPERCRARRNRASRLRRR